MSSPLRRSNSRSSPARFTPNGFRRSQMNGHYSPARPNADSPSRQLVEEFNKIYIDDERAFRKKLDEQADEQERLHREALAKSLAEHEQVRQSAERARERLELEMERAKRRKAEEEAAALEQERRQIAEAEAAAKQREIEQAKRREEELKQAAAKQKELDDAQLRIDAQKRQNEEEKAKREAERLKAEADRKAREEAAAKEQAQKLAVPTPASAAATSQPSVPKPQSNGTSADEQPATSLVTNVRLDPASAPKGVLMPTGIITPRDAREAEHKRYLDLHQRLKKLRNDVQDEAKKLNVKGPLGDKRRELTTTIGQNNKIDLKAQKAMKLKTPQIINEGTQMMPTTVDITPYLIDPPPSAAGTQVPVGLLFMLNHFVKAIVRQLTTEASEDAKSADQLGILVVMVFANPNFRPNGICLIDIFWAKYHKICPVLFGIDGPAITNPAALARLGYLEGEGDVAHWRRMRGLAAGFAAVTLRDFSKSANENPAPNHLYWTALARIVSTPPERQSPTQYTVLFHMTNLFVPKFIHIYGTAALAALRKACIDFPATAPKGSASDGSIVAMQSLPHTLRKEFGLSL